MALISFTDTNDEVIIQPPVFYDFFSILNENNRKILLNPLILKNGKYEIDFEDLEVKASRPSCKMIFLCNPHNPVGRVWSSQELKQLGDICHKHNVLVVSDEMHGDIVFSGHKFIPFASLGEKYAQNSISLLSPAKTFNIASLCSSFTIIANLKLRDKFKAQNSKLTVNKNNALSNTAMEAAYKSGHVWLDGIIEYLEENLKILNQQLSNHTQVKVIQPEGTFMAWLDFRKLNLKQTDLMTHFSDHGLIFSSGHKYGNNGIGFVRLNFACDRDKLIDGLTKLERILNM